MFRTTLCIITLFVCNFLQAEIIQTTDGRTVDLKDDGTYEILENKESIDIMPISCVEDTDYEIKLDDFGNVEKYYYRFGFLMSYKVTNNTSHPIALNKLVFRYSKDYGFVGTERMMGYYNNPIKVNESVSISDSGIGHALGFYVKEELNQDEINNLKEENGCTDLNFTNQTISIVLAETEFKTHPDAGNVDWRDLIAIKKQFKKFGSLQFNIN